MKLLRDIINRINITIFWKNAENKKRFAILFLGVCLFYVSVQKTNASGIFPKEDYVLSQNESMLICPSGRKSCEFSLKAGNGNIIDIDEKGVITGKSQGSCFLEAVEYKTGKVSRCKINVKPAKRIVSAYALPCQAVSGKPVCLFAVADSNARDVKFVLGGQGTNREISGKKIKTSQNKVIWSAEISVQNAGDYFVRVYDNSGGRSSELGKEIKFKVAPCDKSSESLSSPRYASEGIIKFISSCEGFSPRLIPDCKNSFSIGYGHIVEPFTAFYKDIIQQQALALLIDDVTNSSYGRILNKFLLDNNILFNQHQFDALLSFTYNLGVGWITKGSELKNLILDINSGKRDNNLRFFGDVTSQNGLNLRCSPSVNSKKITALRFGERVEILNSNRYNNFWYLVKTDGGKTGYCHGDYVKVFSISNSSKNLKDINRDKFIKLFSAYHHAGGRCSSGLLSRRFHELDVFFDRRYSEFYHLYYKKSPYKLPGCMV